MRFLRFLALLAIGCLVSMGVAFTITRLLMRADRPMGGVDSEVRRAALDLRGTANDLFDLAERLADQTTAHAGAAEIQPWLNNVYLPELKRLRDRIVQEERLPAGPARQLEHAAEMLIQAAKAPSDRELRNLALAQARAASRAVEEYIAASGIGRLPEPRRRME